jgi:Rrf2 family cysteine metabolism transcriptional repressor
MKISTKGRYGLRALLDLAVHAGSDATTLAVIAERQQISVGYLEQIISPLRKAGIVIGTKGPQGGYVLAMSPYKTSVLDILDVLEGDLFSVTEDRVDDAEAAHMQAVIRRQVWDTLNDAALAAMKGVTLGDLVETYRQLNIDGSYDFNI